MRLLFWIIVWCILSINVNAAYLGPVPLQVSSGGTGFTSNTPTALTNASTVTVPAITGLYTTFTLSTTTGVGNVSISNPSSFSAGQSILFIFTEDSTGGEGISFTGTDYNFPNGTPYFNTNASAKNVVSCFADTSSTIQCASTYSNAFTIGITPPPGGRISDNSSNCSHTSDSTTITTLYYVDCAGNGLPISPNDASFLLYQIPSTSTTLSTANSTNFPANTLFDFYAFIHSGAVTYCAVAWGTSTAGSSSRGGSAGITQLQGIWVNSGAWTCLNGATSYTLTTGEATLLGTFVISGTAQDIAMQFAPSAASGGAACNISYANIYNTYDASCISRDNKTTWTYESTTIEQLDASTTNQANWVDPLGSFTYNAQLTVTAKSSTAADPVNAGVGINSTTAFSGSVGSQGYGGSGVDVTEITGISVGPPPQTSGGLNYAAALQQSYSGSVTATYYGTGITNTPQSEGLVLNTRY